MYKVALSPHVISVWIKMDYWITRGLHRVRDSQSQKKKMYVEDFIIMFQYRL